MPRRQTVVVVATAALFATAGLVALMSRSASSNPLVSAAPHHERFRAVVTNVMPAGSYTYFEVVDGRGQLRAVVTLGAAPWSADVEVEAFARSTDFFSKRLGRRFPELLFGAVRAAAVPTPTRGEP